MRSLATLACLMLLACGSVSSPPPPDGPAAENHDGLKSGSRLKLRWNDFDGTKVFAGLWDSTRSEACTARKFTDAKTYCVPTSGTIVYRDAACTMPIGRQTRSCPQVQVNYFTDTDPQTCDNLAKRIFPRGAQLGGTVSYYTLSGTTCSGPIDGSSFDMFALGNEVALSEFATLETPAPTEPGRFQQRFAESSDGARVFAGTYDADLATDCSVVLDGARTGARCVPVASNFGSYYGDANCSTQRATFRKGCAVPKFSTRYSTFCSYVPAVPEVFRTGALTTAAVFLPNGTPPPTCTAVVPSTETSFYELGAQVTLDTLTRTPDTDGKGRYRLIHTGLGTSRLRDGQLYDTARQTECTPTTMTDGSVRCMPLNTYAVSPTIYYSDSACTIEQPIVFVPGVPATNCTLPPVPPFATRTTVTTNPTCSITREVRQVSALYAGTLYVKNPLCNPVNLGTTLAYTLGVAGSPDDWAAATVVTDP